MNINDSKLVALYLILVLLFAATACGTLEVSTAPEATITEPFPVATEVTPPTPVQDSKETDNAATAVATPEEVTAPAIEATPEPTEPSVEDVDQAETTQPEARPSEITMLDETWFNYTNYQLGFSINFPRTKIHHYGSCRWNEENGDHSYRPDPAHVPVKIFEDGDRVYITSEYRHELGGETRETSADGGPRIFFSECLAVPNSLELLQDPEYYQEMWEIVVREAGNDEELEGFLKDRHGSGCSLGEKEPTAQDGVYRVRIQGDGKDLSETQCPLTGGIVVKYYPEGNKVIAWITGQASTFAADVNNTATYDQEMVDSFRFLTDESAAPSVDSVEYDYDGWQLYTNETWGYSLMHPGNTEIMGANQSESVQFVGPMVDDENWPVLLVHHFDSAFFHPPAGTEVRDWIAESNIPYEPLEENLTIGGLPAVRIVIEASPMAYGNDEYYVINGDQLFRITLLHTSGLQDWALYDQFLQSITFESVQ